MTYTKTFLCQINGGCMGCCGHGFQNKEELQQAIQLNTQEFQELNPQTESQFLRFRERAPRMDLRNGLCRNLIEKDHKLLCPLHPEQNLGKDLRETHCDTNHLCLTAKEFNSWDKQKQLLFLQFIKNKSLDNIDYSIKMDNHSLLKEFKSLKHLAFASSNDKS